MPIVLQPAVKNSEIDHELVKLLAKQLNIVRPLAEVLYTRGYTDIDKLNSFLNINYDALFNPQNQRILIENAEIIKTTINTGHKITVYGDYDVDGICATAILYRAIKELGGQVEYYLPNRHNEGYGLNSGAVERIAATGTKLLVTVDCGIASFKEVETAKAAGMQVIITDHHELPDTLPQCPIINPKMGNMGYKDLCGAGVALKLAAALLGQERAEKYFDLAAIATIADIVPLTGDNRAIVKKGLELINTNPREGVRQLALQSGLDLASKTLSSSDIAFILAPRLNAAGRISDPRLSLELFIDESKAKENAAILQEYNVKRQDIENEILNQAIDMAYKSGQVRDRRILVLASEGWEQGVIGIVASRMAERFNRPCILFSINKSIATGSARSIKGVHIFNILNEFNNLFIKFGGHEMAAGMTIETHLLDELLDSLDEYIKAEVDPKYFYPVAKYDARARLAEINTALCEQMHLLEPFGMGNPIPKFRIDNLRATNIRVIGKNENHLKASLYDELTSIEAVAYNYLNTNVSFEKQNSYTVIATPMISSWNNVSSVILKIDALNRIKDLNAVKQTIKDNTSHLTASFFAQSYCKAQEQTGQNFYLFDNAEEFMGEVVTCLNEDIAGTLLLCSNPRISETMAEFVFNTSPRTDICFFTPFDLANGYNTLLMAPRHKDINFNCYKNIFICDLYDVNYISYIASMAPHAEVVAYCTNAAEMFATLDKKYTDLSRSTMGRIYKTLSRVAEQGGTFKSEEKLKDAIMLEDNFLDHCLISFGLAVFEELELISITPPPNISLKINKIEGQTNLTKSSIYNKITKYLA